MSKLGLFHFSRGVASVVISKVTDSSRSWCTMSIGYLGMYASGRQAADKTQNRMIPMSYLELGI